ncbi:MAG TPA: LysR family transcriptional regulator [Candidatus Angelobacter sp.]|nr:LysR family transcriptional regulator [Candidatus Angelobacter sp.]
MNLAAIDLNLLVALDALIAEVHVGRAAHKIGLSQPAASHALNRLRDLLGDPLLVRVGSRMELTPRAMAVRDSLPEVLRRVHTLLVPDSFEPATSTRRFSVMMQDHVAHLIVPALVKHIRSAAPGVTLDVLPWQNPSSMKPERARSIDMLISCSSNEIAGFERETLFTDTEVTVVRKAHPAAARIKNLRRFLGSNHVAVVGKGMAEDPVDSWLRQEGLVRNVVLRVPSYLQALQAVALSDLIALVPRRLAESLAKPLSLAVLAAPVDPGEYQEYLFHPLRTAHDPASKWLRELALAIGAEVERGQRQAASRKIWPRINANKELPIAKIAGIQSGTRPLASSH